ncbi:hypothetical protein NIES4071_109960 (plasmid) [Calothrix sp. NIES-4071]|nr:hypothetical protein NIES4071_109960 [Calothrix sp. NIES-4071]BAZ65239.1 hypothetical protein NIES4105_109720 [Calothrix sp. NIES-4105]
MKENLKKPETIYGAIAVSLMVLFIAPLLSSCYQEKQQEAQARETCKQLRAFYEDSLRRAKAGIKLESGEAEAARRAKFYSEGMCPDLYKAE